jgi:hypothetical protein
MVERKGVLVTLGEEDRVRSPLLKTWDLEKVDKKLSMGTPVLLRSVKVQTGNLPHPVSLCCCLVDSKLMVTHMTKIKTDREKDNL